MSSRDSLLPSAQGCSLRESLRKQKGVKISSLGFSLVLWQPLLVGRVTRSAKEGKKRRGKTWQVTLQGPLEPPLMSSCHNGFSKEVTSQSYRAGHSAPRSDSMGVGNQIQPLQLHNLFPPFPPPTETEK